MSKNSFGGKWTQKKMQIIIDYAKAYLIIMNKQSWAKTIYFDGFAGSGQIDGSKSLKPIKGTALRILEIDDPKPFDIYYFVELRDDFKNSLELEVQKNYFGKNAHVVQADCNDK